MERSEREREVVLRTLHRLDNLIGLTRRRPNKIFNIYLDDGLLIFKSQDEEESVIIPGSLLDDDEIRAIEAGYARAMSRNEIMTYDTTVTQSESRDNSGLLDAELDEIQRLDEAAGGDPPYRNNKLDELTEQVTTVALELDEMKKKISKLENENDRLRSDLTASRAEMRELVYGTTDQAHDSIYYTRGELEKKIENLSNRLEAMKTLKLEKDGRARDERTALASNVRERCYNCGQLGHRAAACTRSGILCYRCRRCENHTSDNCPYTDEEVSRIRREDAEKYNKNNKGKDSFKRKNYADSNHLDAKRSKMDEGHKSLPWKNNYNGRNNRGRGRGRGRGHGNYRGHGHKGTENQNKGSENTDKGSKNKTNDSK